MSVLFSATLTIIPPFQRFVNHFFQLFSIFFKKTLAFSLHIQYNHSMSEVILTQNKIHGRIPEWPKGTDCKSAANCFDGSNPSPSICRSGGTGRRPGLKIPWVVIPVPVRSRFAARLRALIHTNRSSFSISIFQSPVPTTSLAAARSVLRDAAARRPSLLASMQYHSR